MRCQIEEIQNVHMTLCYLLSTKAPAEVSLQQAPDKISIQFKQDIQHLAERRRIDTFHRTETNARLIPLSLLV
jgi:hypothetical protein